MPTAIVDGIETYYETHGSGTPILMCAPGGFDATIEKWRVASAWTGIDAHRPGARPGDMPIVVHAALLGFHDLIAFGFQ